MTLKNSIQCLLFDLDGTLLDTSFDFAYALNLTCKHYQHPAINHQDLLSVISGGASAMVSYAFPEASHEDLIKIKETFLDFYTKNIARHTQVYPGLNEGLERLAEQNIPWGVVTNKPKKFTHELLSHIKFPSQPNTIICGDTLDYNKPHPAPMLLAAQECNTAPKNCLYLGDHPRDIEAGNHADMVSGIVLYGYINSPNFPPPTADMIFPTPYDITLFIKETF